MELGSSENLEAQQRVENMGSGIRLPGSEFSALTYWVCDLGQILRLGYLSLKLR